MECNIKIVKLKKVLPPGTYPKRECNVRYFYHRTDGCYYMYDEKGCETNLTTCGEIIPIDRELIVGSESLDSNTLVCIGLKANYVRPSANGVGCGCQDTYIKAWTYISDLKDFIETGGIDRKYYRVSLTSAPNEGGVVGCSGSAILPDENSDGFRFSFEAGSTVRVYAKATPGYSFVGWKEYHTNEIISISPEWSFTIKKDMDLIGVFKKDEVVHKTYYINCNASPSNAGYVVGAGRFEDGTRHSIIAQAIDGYSFINWKNSKGEIVSTIPNYEFIVTKDETFTAYFELDTVTYKLDANITPSGMGTVQGLGSYNEGETANIKVIPNSLYDIKSVTASSGILIDKGDGNYSIVMNDNITLNVELVRTYTFTIVSNGNGKVRYKDLKGSYSNWDTRHSVRAPEMTVVTIQGQADNNYKFDYWLNPEGARFEENQNNIIVNADVDNRTYTCYFKENVPAPFVKRRVTISATNGKVMSQFLELSRPSVSNDSFDVDNGTDVKFTAFPEEGYTFKEWNVNSVRHTENPYTHNVTEDITVNAIFKENAKPKFNVTIKDLVDCCTFTGDGEYEQGSQCTINIKAKLGFKIESVRKNNEVIRLEDNGDYTFTVTENVEFVIDGRRAEYNVTCKIVPEGSAVVTGTGSYNFEDPCTLTCTANEGYRIVSLQVNGDMVELTQGKYKFNVTSNYNCILTCEQLPKLPVTVEVTPKDAATFTGNGEYKKGDSCTLHVDVAEGYVLKNILANGSKIQLDSSGNYTFTVNEATTIKITCEEKAPDKFTVNAICTPSNGGVVNGIGQFNNGDRCTFTVVANSGFEIDTVKLKTSKGEVTISLDDQNSYNVQVEEDITILVTFRELPKIQITVATTTGNTNHGFVGFDETAESETKTIEVLPNTKVTLFAKPQQGYKFRAWYDEDMVIAEGEDKASYQITATTNKTYKAEFLRDAYLDVSPSELVFEASGGTQYINIDSNVEWTVS